MKKKTLILLAILSVTAWVSNASQQQLAKSIQEARIETGRTAEQLKATVSALNALTKQTKGDLRPSYDAYCTEVTRTESVAASTRNRIQWMAGDGRQYFRDWQQTINGIANESLRKKAQKRFDSVQADYDKVEVSLKEAGDKFKPFLSDLNDIKSTLASDVTPSGVKAVRGTVRSANWDHKFVTRSVDTALKGMGEMEKSLSSEMK